MGADAFGIIGITVQSTGDGRFRQLGNLRDIPNSDTRSFSSDCLLIRYVAKFCPPRRQEGCRKRFRQEVSEYFLLTRKICPRRVIEISKNGLAITKHSKSQGDWSTPADPQSRFDKVCVKPVIKPALLTGTSVSGPCDVAVAAVVYGDDHIEDHRAHQGPRHSRPGKQEKGQREDAEVEQQLRIARLETVLVLQP